MQTTKSRNQNHFLSKLLSLSGFFLVPLCTLYLGTLTNVLYQNFTYLANQPSTKVPFILWAIVSLSTHFLLLNTIYTEQHLTHRNYIPLALSLLVVALFLPYPNGSSLFGLLHVLFGYLAFILYNYVLFQIYLQTKHYHLKKMKSLLSCYLLVLSTCTGIVLAYGSINGLAEIIYFSLTPILLTITQKTLLKA